MNIVKASESGKGLKITDIESTYNRRIAAEIFNAEGGIAYAEAGWPTNDTGHPYHYIEGEVEGSGPWVCGRFLIEEMTPTDELWQDLLIWNEYKAQNLRTSRDQALMNCSIELRWAGPITG